ncbi:MAG: hypothetical protein ACLQUT_05320 [Thermoleophilia bacterium]
MPNDAWQRTVLRQRAFETVQSARRLGLLIESDPRLGYRCTGYDDLPKYVHLTTTADNVSEPISGQMSLSGTGAAYGADHGRRA